LLCLQSAQKLVAAAAAAAASAAASAALNKQPWDTLELEMEVVETTRPFFKSGSFAVIGECAMLHAAQLQARVGSVLAQLKTAAANTSSAAATVSRRTARKLARQHTENAAATGAAADAAAAVCNLCLCAPAGTLLLMVQLLLCFAVAFLWAREADEEEEGQCDEEHVDLKQQKQQEWASMAEEGRGLYEKLLSYT
jgi:hypothetical protein